jgi:hypothetical protein
MKLLTALRWLNGTTLLMALSVWLVVTILVWLGSFTKGAAQTVWNTGVMFASGFQENRRSPAPPGIPFFNILTGLTFAALWLSVFLPNRLWWLHGCAAAGALLMVWNVWMLRAHLLGQASMLVLGLWFVYYWAAAWRSSSGIPCP